MFKLNLIKVLFNFFPHYSSIFDLKWQLRRYEMTIDRGASPPERDG